MKPVLLDQLEKTEIVKKLRFWFIVVVAANLVLLPHRPETFLIPLACYAIITCSWLVFINPIYKHQYGPTLFIIRNAGLMWMTFGIGYNLAYP